jgi:hypothetical protein
VAPDAYPLPERLREGGRDPVTTYPPPEEGFCVCGRPLPEQPLSDWACSEPCQSAWFHHHADPEYPHPREIRQAAEQALTEARALGTPRRAGPGDTVAEGTEIDVDGHAYVRVGSYWQPAGMWTPLRDALGEAARYRRWCPVCRRRVDSQLYPASDVQECTTCQHQWDGRPLLGWVETRDAPWPGIRLLLSDGQRSTARAFSHEEVGSAGAVAMADRLNRSWLRLERQLCGGYADMDQPDDRQRRRRDRRVAQDWHLCMDPS